MSLHAASIIEVIDDPELLGRWYAGPSWNLWRAVLKGAFGVLTMTAEELELFRAVAERDPPTERVKELIAIAGRRAGKDSIAAAIAIYFAAFGDYRDKLRPGERAVVMCLACDREQAKIVLNYIGAAFTDIPLLKAMVTRHTADGVELNNGVDIVVSTNNFRAVRGRTIVLAIFDEAAYWRDDNSASPDKETYRAVRPGMATIVGAMIVIISSPYRKAGLLYDKWKKHYGRDSADVLVVKGPSALFNPTLDQGIVAAALEDDPEAARAEWLGDFRDDISGYVDQAVVDAVTIAGRHELPPVIGAGHVAFLDPAGGSGSDSMTLAIAHRDEAGRGILDAIRERKPPFSPDDVVQEFSTLMKAYGIARATGDKWGGGWPVERLERCGIFYEQSAKPKSDIYREFLPILNSGRCELLDHPRLMTQLCNLERRTARGGRDSIDHASGVGANCHDDVANSVAGVLVAAAGELDSVALWAKLHDPRDPPLQLY